MPWAWPGHGTQHSRCQTDDASGFDRSRIANERTPDVVSHPRAARHSGNTRPRDRTAMRYIPASLSESNHLPLRVPASRPNEDKRDGLRHVYSRRG